MKKLALMFLVLLVMVTLTGCKKDEVKKTEVNEFKNEYESLNGKSNDYFEYRTVSIDEENPFEFVSIDDIVKKIEDKETFYVYFGDSQCPWCRSVIEQAIKSAKENNVNKIYYVKIWKDFHEEVVRDVYKLNSNNEPEFDRTASDSYYKVLKYFDSVLSDYVLTDIDGNKIFTGEKRIFAPNFIFVEDGKAVRMVEGISSLQKGYNDDLTDDIISDEKKIFDEFFSIKFCKSDNC